MAVSQNRLFFLDWLRVLAFALLVFYHAGLVFVDWGFHITNNEFSEGLKLPLLFLNQWRLPLLYFVSGAGISFALGKRKASAFLRERTVRLLIPLVFGMLVVVPPQSFYELKSQGVDFPGYLAFYSNYYFPDHLTWNHLWFVAYLFTFVLVATPAFLFLRWKSNALDSLAGIIQARGGGVLLIVPLVVIEWSLRDRWPDYRNLVSDWYNFAFYFTVFVYGYLIARMQSAWEAFERDRWIYLVVALLSFGLMYFGWHAPGVGFLETTRGGKAMFGVLKCADVICTIVACIGFARRHLNFASPVLDYTNKAVYPFYILHQTVLIVVGYYVIGTGWSISLKYLVIVVATFFVSGLCYEFLIRRWRAIRPLFGVK